MLRFKSLILCLPAVFLGCNGEDQGPLATDDETQANVEELEIAGLDNVYRLSSRVITGGKPKTESGFAELQKLGVKTIVSVTDDNPNEETARKYGLKYVHVPMNYDGVSAEQRQGILGAFSKGNDPVYIHCNSGRNRGATAAAMCLIGVEGKSNAEAISWMKTRGVDEKNVKLFEAVEGFKSNSQRE